MPAGDIEILKNVIYAINKFTDDFIVLSTHDDVDILLPKIYKFKVKSFLERYGFKSTTLNNIECLYDAEPVISYYDDNGCHIDIHTGLNYTSLDKKYLVPINNEFLEYVYFKKIQTNDMWKYNLSVESDIVHTVCRIIFDKGYLVNVFHAIFSPGTILPDGGPA